MFGFLKSESFNMIFSGLLGLGIMVTFKPGCRGGECSIQRAPPVDEIRTSTYQMGDGCYKFHSEVIECPKEGVIEPFERFVR